MKCSYFIQTKHAVTMCGKLCSHMVRGSSFCTDHVADAVSKGIIGHDMSDTGQKFPRYFERDR